MRSTVHAMPDIQSKMAQYDEMNKGKPKLKLPFAVYHLIAMFYCNSLKTLMTLRRANKDMHEIVEKHLPVNVWQDGLTPQVINEAFWPGCRKPYIVEKAIEVFRGNTTRIQHLVERFVNDDCAKMAEVFIRNGMMNHTFNLNTAFFIATSRGDHLDEDKRKKIDLLLAKGCAITAVPDRYLEYLAVMGEFDKMLDVVKRASYVNHELMFGIKGAGCIVLAHKKDNINRLSKKGETILTHAVLEKFDIERIQQLIDLGALINATNAKGKTALDIAVEHDLYQYVEILVANGALAQTGEHAVHSQQRSMERAETLARNVAEVKNLVYRQTSSHDEAYRKFKQISALNDNIQLLLAEGADFKKVDVGGNTLLFGLYDTGTVRIFINHLRNIQDSQFINVANNRGITCLQRAIQDNQLEIVSILISEGHAK